MQKLLLLASWILLWRELSAGRNAGEEDDWASYYVNIFVNRDMFMGHQDGTMTSNKITASGSNGEDRVDNTGGEDRNHQDDCEGEDIQVGKNDDNREEGEEEHDNDEDDYTEDEDSSANDTSDDDNDDKYNSDKGDEEDEDEDKDKDKDNDLSF
ncbi:hypothetical protein SERLA73DRAFT_153123 [Serpula lacrymans var. lacrymans S7.3]|uniref:Uncharacterized protein n=1 Tax=Serpula lacrymans var. lacrymans (strain S7.3) TaxID=936435 RepID=F8Q0M0_SERL3|nr:hypothetical protein SERLA73DRAFT_153123 [Serpula lacrymans var. lacrymans S7.3]